MRVKRQATNSILFTLGHSEAGQLVDNNVCQTSTNTAGPNRVMKQRADRRAVGGV